MRKKVFNNIFLKIISIILAFILWLVLVNVSDPTTKITISGVNVQVENENAFLEKGYTYSIADGSRISVDVSGPKSKITSLSSSDIQAVVDLSQVSAFSDYANIKVSAVQNGKVIKDVKLMPKISSVKLSIANRSSKDLKVETVITGSPKADHIVARAYTDQEMIRIAGPDDEVSSIASARAVIDISNADGNVNKDVALKLYDADGNEIKNTSVELSRTNVKVTAEIKDSRTVPIKYSLKGSRAENFRVKEVKISQNSAVLSGSRESLGKINQIELPQSSLDISNINSNKTFRFWISDYLPEGVGIVSENLITIDVVVEPVQ